MASKEASQKLRCLAQVLVDFQLAAAAAAARSPPVLLPSPSILFPPDPSSSWTLRAPRPSRSLQPPSIRLSPDPSSNRILRAPHLSRSLRSPAPRSVLETGPPSADLPAPWSPCWTARSGTETDPGAGPPLSSPLGIYCKAPSLTNNEVSWLKRRCYCYFFKWHWRRRTMWWWEKLQFWF